MPFPIVDDLVQGDEWRHPVTDQLYVVGPNGVMQRISSNIDSDGLATIEYVDAQDDLKLSLTGGTVDGRLDVTFTEAPLDNTYVFNVIGSKLPEGQTSAFRVTASGSVKAGHNNVTPFMAVASNDVVTKGFLENALDEHIIGDNYYTKNEVDQLNDLTLKRFGNNDVATGEENEENIFRIRAMKADGRRMTCLAINDENMGLYNLKEPEETHHAATKGYVDVNYLPLTGGEISGVLSVPTTPENNAHVANKKYVDDARVELNASISRVERGLTERRWKLERGTTIQAKSICHYEAAGFWYYMIDLTPDTGRELVPMLNFDFKTIESEFKIGWIYPNGREEIVVSAKAILVRKSTSGSIHFFTVGLDPSADTTIIHDPYKPSSGAEVVCTLNGLF